MCNMKVLHCYKMVPKVNWGLEGTSDIHGNSKTRRDIHLECRFYLTNNCEFDPFQVLESLHYNFVQKIRQQGVLCPKQTLYADTILSFKYQLSDYDF